MPQLPICAADVTGPVGSKEHRDWCDYHGRWTFDCLLKIKETFRPLPKVKAKSTAPKE